MQLLSTYKATVKRYWIAVRSLASIGILVSGLVYWQVSSLAGFLTLIISTVFYTTLMGREYLIDNLRRISVVSELRERLLTYGDNEYVLRNIMKDQIWRGDPVDPEITKRLEEIDKYRNEFMARVTEIATNLIGEFKAENKKEAN